MEEKIKLFMKKLDITEEEARQLIADDKAIDKGANLFPLTKEQEKASKKVRSVSRAPTVYKFNKRERKIDNDKQYLINLLVSTLENEQLQTEIINKEREIIFHYNNKKYKIVMSCPRT